MCIAQFSQLIECLNKVSLESAHYQKPLLHILGRYPVSCLQHRREDATGEINMHQIALMHNSIFLQLGLSQLKGKFDDVMISMRFWELFAFIIC